MPELDAGFTLRWMRAVAAAVDREADRLTELDSPIGDADHGANLRRGFAAVTAALTGDPPDTPGAVLTRAGRTLVSSVGGAAGPLYGTLLRRMGACLGDARRVPVAALAAAMREGVAAVGEIGGSGPGDKTMLDALVPAAQALDGPGSFEAARRAAREGAVATEGLRARRGRASYLGDRSIGHQDPGAASSVLLVGCLADVAAGG